MDSQVRTKRLLSDSTNSPPKRSRWFTIDVPKSQNKDEEKEEKPVLLLKPFSPVPHVCFDKVKLGSSKTRALYLQNPFDTAQDVIIEKFPFENGFFTEEMKFYVDANEEKSLSIMWKPEKASNCRETIKFKSSLGCKMQAYLLGAAYSPPKRKTNKSLRPKVLKENIKANGCNAGTVNSQPSIKSILTSNKENVESGVTLNTYFSTSETSVQKFLPSRQSVYFALSDEQEFPDSPIRRQTYSIKNMFIGGRKSEIIPVQNQKPAENILAEKQFFLQPSRDEISVNVVDFKPFCSRDSFNVMKHEPSCLNDSFKYSVVNVDDDKFNLKRKTFNVLKNKTDCNEQVKSARTEKHFEVSQQSVSSSDAHLISGTEDKVMVHNLIDKHIYFGLSPESLAINDKRYTHVIRQNSSKDPGCSFESGSDCFSTEIMNDTGKDNFKLSDVFKRCDSHLDVSFSGLSKYLENDISNRCSTIKVDEEKVSENNRGEVAKKDMIEKTSKSVRFSNVNEIISNDKTNNISNHNSDAVFLDFNSNLQQEQVQSKWNVQLKEDYSYKKATISDSTLPDVSCSTLKVGGEKPYKQSTVKESSNEEHFKFPECKNSRETYFEIPFDVKKALPEAGESSKAFQPILPDKPSVSVGSETVHKSSSSVDKKKLKHSPFKAKTLRSMLKKAQPDKASAGVKHRENPAKFLPRRLNLKKSKVPDPVLSHRNPYASSNLYYDKHWMEKQETAFTNWLNYILTPADSFNSSDVEVDSAKIWIESIKDIAPVRAPTKEELSLKTYTALKNLNQLRKACCMLYQSDEISAVVKTIEKEVDMKRLSVRKDRALHADLGIKKEILDMLLSYNSLWLRIGLETIYGEIIMLQSNCDVVGLSRFIIRRLLSDPEITSKFSHVAVINYFKPGYEEEIKRFTLKKFLLLVYFLDKAKVGHLIKNDPCLFSKNAKYKCSRDLLLAFSRDYLSGEGDITKHLRYLGYKVTHQQTALEEFDFSVKNIAVDLRCGLRLGRVVELLFQDWTISKVLRINTTSRLNKVHNNDVILKALQKASIEIENDISAKDLVDGHREKTLDLLWQVVFKTQISKLLNKELLRQENAFLCRNLKLKSDYAAFKVLRNPNTESEFSQPSFLDSKLYKEHEVLQLLLQWCQNVCAYYGLKVHNFTSSFSDGRVLCLLLHHYHPNLLPYKNIKTETSYTFFEKQMIAAEADDSSSPFLPNKGLESSVSMKELLKNEVHNLGLAFQKFQEIGQIPILSSPSHMSNTLPDEKVIITLVSYVNMRLMELSVEIRAARKILHAWRRWHLRKDQDRLKVEISAVIVIQKAWREFVMRENMKKRVRAAIVIQSIWRKYSAIKQLKTLKQQKHLQLLNQKAKIIQACFRGHITRRYILKCHNSAVVIQSHARMWLLKSKFQEIKKATLRIQQKYRAKVLGRSQRLKFVSLKRVVIKLQAYSKGFFLRKMLEKQRNAAIVIQSNVRSYLAVKNFQRIRKACLFIQRKYRATVLTKNVQEQYQRQKAAAIQLQKWYRSAIMARILVKSAVKIQAVIRGFLFRKHYISLKNSVIKIQTWWRSCIIVKQAQISYAIQRRQIILVQSAVRKFIAFSSFKRKRQSAVVIQKHFRAFYARKHFHLLKRKIICIQEWYRNILSSRKTRKEYLHLKQATIKIQSWWRSCIAVKQAQISYAIQRRQIILVQSAVRKFIAVSSFKRKRQAAVVIQKHFRAFYARRHFHLLKRKIVCIQEWYRNILSSRKTRKEYLHLKQAAVKIQSWWRSCIIVKQAQISYAIQRRQIILVQSAVRKFIAVSSFKCKRQSAVVIQKHFRAFYARKSFSLLKRKIICIQEWYRNILSSRKIRKEYLHLKQAVIKIQSWYRMCHCRKSFLNLKKAVSVIELYRLGKCKRARFLKLRQSSIVIQSCYRGYAARKSYLRMKNAVQVLEKHFIAKKIGQEERCKYLEMKHSATLIQASFRGYREKNQFLRWKQAALKIQQYYCSYRMMLLQRQRFLKMKVGFVHLQAAYRGTRVRKHHKQLNEKAVIIQTSYRSWVAQRKYKKLKAACIIVQQKYRAKVKMLEERQRYLKMKKGFVQFQALYRGLKTRKHIKHLNHQAVIIQTTFRRWIKEKRYKKLKQACILVQQKYRAQRKMHVSRKHYLKMKHGFTCLQALYRGFRVRKQYIAFNGKATQIQAFYKKWNAQKKYLRLRHACITVQRKYRAKLLMKFYNDRYLQMKKGFICLQALYRGSRVRTQNVLLNEKAIIIQSAFRSWVLNNRYKKLKCACITIQQKYRAQVLMRSHRQNYLKMKKGFTRLQAVHKGVVARRQIALANQNAILIQSVFRRWSAQKKYLELRNSCMILQQRYRAQVKMRVDRQQYLTMKKGFVHLQAVYRGLRVRKQNAVLMHNAIVIQSAFRRWVMQKKYVEFRSACIIIQQRYKAQIKMRIDRQKYLKMKKGFIHLQAIYRSSKVRKQIALYNHNAIIIQSAFRGWRMHEKYKDVRRACIITQQRYKAQIKMRVDRQKYLKMKKGFTHLQAIYRGSKVRKQIALYNHNAIIIQSAFRGWRMHEKYKDVRRACIITQQRYKAQIKMRIDRQKYLKMKKGFTHLQAIYRGSKARKKIAFYNRNAIIIQSAFRGWRMHKKYKDVRRACIITQQRYKAQIKMRIDRQKYLKMKKGFTHLQAIYRGSKVRKQIAFYNHNAIIIQSAFRGWRMHKKYKKLRQACLVMQQRYRAQTEMNLRQKEYLKMKNGFVRLQAVYRGSKVRKHKEFLIHNAAIIQSAFRRWVAQKKYNKMRRACITIQQRYRARVEMVQNRKGYLKMKKGFVLLQALYHGSKVRRHIQLCNQNAVTIQTAYRKWLVQKNYRKLRESCILLQKYIRMYLLRKRFLVLKSSATKIQCYYRCYKKMCSDRERYLTMKVGFLSLQALYRGIKVRNHYALLNRKATIIQTSFRRWNLWKKYKKKREACIVIQRRFRACIKMHIHQQNYLIMKQGFLCLQALVRGSIVRKNLSNLNKRAILIQSYVRKWIVQKKYRTLRRTCIILQQKYRANREMRKMREQFWTLKNAAVTLQAAIRCYLARKKYTVFRNASIKVQSIVRMFIAKKNYKNQQSAAICIQSLYRMCLARRKFRTLKHSCITIQSLCRRHIAQKRFYEVRNSVIVIQRYFFAIKKAKEQRHHYLHMKHAAVLIQSHFRAYRLKAKFLKMKHAVIKIEQYYIAYKKMVAGRQKYLKMVKGFIQLQALCRGIKARKYLSTLHKSAVIIQAYYRGCLVRRCYHRIKAAIVIQRNFRLWKQKRLSYVSNEVDLQKDYQLHLWYSQLRKSVVKFQRCARSYLQKRTEAATVIQSYVRMWFVQRELRRHEAARKIQAVWRGFVLRCSITNSDILKAQMKIKAADSSDSNKLKNRTRESLHMLLNGEKLHNIILALNNLDVCTRLSPNCCESLVLSGSLAVLLNLLQSCNRSVPHMEIIKLTTSILLNIAKYNKTVKYLWREMPSLELYLHLMKIFREKGVEIFTKCCTLVWIFCQDPEKAELIKRNEIVTDQLLSLHFLLSRKQVMQEKRQLLKVASSAANSTMISASFCKNKSRSTQRESVEIEPDWMLGKQRKREFTDPLIAITSVLRSLGLEAKKSMPK